MCGDVPTACRAAPSPTLKSSAITCQSPPSSFSPAVASSRATEYVKTCWRFLANGDLEETAVDVVGALWSCAFPKIAMSVIWSFRVVDIVTHSVCSAPMLFLRALAMVVGGSSRVAQFGLGRVAD